MKIIANIKSRIGHAMGRNDGCRASEIKKENKRIFKGENAEAQMLEAGIRRCKARGCWPA
jgi:hypothetical protein